MNQTKNYSIVATVELKFNDSETRDNSFNSFFPEFSKLQTKRSNLRMEKKNNSLLFYIESADITAFRASISDVIGFGKIIEGIHQITTK